MEATELLQHALTSLPEAVGDLLRAGRDTREYVFASFDGASELGMALIASDPASDLASGPGARSEVERLVRAASARGEELIVSLMVTKQLLTRMLSTSEIDPVSRVELALWLESPITSGHFRVVAVARDQVRAAMVDGVTEMDDAPVSSSMLN